jgi:hypothetical protein
MTQTWRRDNDERLTAVLDQTQFHEGPEPIMAAHALVVSSGARNGTTYHGIVGRPEAVVTDTLTSSTVYVVPWKGGEYVKIRFSRTLFARFSALIRDAMDKAIQMAFTNMQVTGARSFMARDACSLVGPWNVVGGVMTVPACNFGPHEQFPLPAPAPAAFSAPGAPAATTGPGASAAFSGSPAAPVNSGPIGASPGPAGFQASRAFPGPGATVAFSPSAATTGPGLAAAFPGHRGVPASPGPAVGLGMSSAQMRQLLELMSKQPEFASVLATLRPDDDEGLGN